MFIRALCGIIAIGACAAPVHVPPSHLDGGPRVLSRERAALALGALGAEGARVLAEGVRSPDPETRRLCFEAMRQAFAPPMYAHDEPLGDHPPLGTHQEAVDAVIGALLEGVIDPAEPVRTAARSALGVLDVHPTLCPEPTTGLAVGELVGLLQNEDSRVRDSAARALGGIGSAAAAAVPALVRIVERNAHGALDAGLALGRIGPAAAQAIPLLLSQAKSGWTCEAMGLMGVRDDRVIAALLDDLREHDCALAAQALVRLGVHLDQALPRLARTALYPKGLIYISSGRIDEIGARETLLAVDGAGQILVRAALGSPNNWAHAAAGGALTILPADQVGAALHLLEDAAVRAMRERDGDALYRIAGIVAEAGPRARPIAEMLVPLLDEADEGSPREAVARAVGAAGVDTPAAVRGLARCIEEGDYELRRVALRALDEIGPDDEGAADAVRALVQDSYLGQDALYALSTMGPACARAHREIAEALIQRREGAVSCVLAMGCARLTPSMATALERGPVAPGRYFDLAWPDGVAAPPAARDAFLEKVGNDAIEVSRPIAKAHDTEAALRVLAAALGRGGDRYPVLWAVEEMGPRASPLLPALLRAVEEDGTGIRFIGSLAPEAEAVVPSLVHVLGKNDRWRQTALGVLAGFGPQAADAVPAAIWVWLAYSPERPHERHWDRFAVNAILRMEPDGRSLLAQIPRLRDDLLRDPRRMR